METFDAIIVGSGFGGSIPALRLAEDDRNVLVLEQGYRLTEKDFTMDWSLVNQGGLATAYTSKDYKVFMRYGKGLGGGSLIYAAAMLRGPSEIFDYTDQNGYHVWPNAVTREVFDPYYAMVEEKMQVSRASWADVPKAGGIFAMMLDNMGRTCDRAMYPIVDCLQCGFCMCGCPYGRKKHLGHNYIPQAEQQGAEFRVRCRVDHIEKEGSGYVVVYQDHRNNTQRAYSDMVLLAASALETPAILLRSKNHLTDLHPQVGKNLNQNGDVALVFLLPDSFPKAHLYMGRNNAGMITYDFWEDHKISIHAGAGPPALFAALDVVRDDGGKPDIPFGLEFKQFMKKNYPDHLLSSLAIGLVDGEGNVSVNSQGMLEFDIPMTDHMHNYIERVAGVGREIAEANDAKLMRTAYDSFEHGDAHPLATCRMGDDDEHSPCNEYGELRSHPGIFCTDGSSIPGGTGVNPAHTIAANAERIADYLVNNR